MHLQEFFWSVFSQLLTQHKSVEQGLLIICSSEWTPNAQVLQQHQNIFGLHKFMYMYTSMLLKDRNIHSVLRKLKMHTQKLPSF